MLASVPTRPSQILVFGVPRCGGAAFRQVLRSAGLGPDHDPADPTSPTARFRTISLELLGAAGCDWKRPQSFSASALMLTKGSTAMRYL